MIGWCAATGTQPLMFTQRAIIANIGLGRSRAIKPALKASTSRLGRPGGRYGIRHFQGTGRRFFVVVAPAAAIMALPLGGRGSLGLTRKTLFGAPDFAAACVSSIRLT